MQIATVTIVVESTGPRFSAESNDIQEKVKAKLESGDYTTDIEDVELEPTKS